MKTSYEKLLLNPLFCLVTVTPSLESERYRLEASLAGNRQWANQSSICGAKPAATYNFHRGFLLTTSDHLSFLLQHPSISHVRGRENLAKLDAYLLGQLLDELPAISEPGDSGTVGVDGTNMTSESRLWRFALALFSSLHVNGLEKKGD